jgi:hypothetical protein
MRPDGEPDPNVRNIAVAVVLSLVTCGIYNVYWQYKQIETLNEMLSEDKYAFVPWLLFTLITCGLYHIYHEYRMSEDIARVTERKGGNDGLIAVVLAIFGLSIVVDAIQQSQINSFYGDDTL